MPITARRPKAEAYEKGIREGTAMAKRSRGSKPTEEEEMDMGMVPKHSRKRSTKGAKNTKPAKDGMGMKKPMDGGMYGKKPMDGDKGMKKEMEMDMCGKKPMDAECGCGKKKGRKYDGDCGYKRKRSDSLTPQEYLTACEMGIQDRSATYIRARLDAAEARNDLKCGKGAISEGEKCTKGPATKVRPKKPSDKQEFRSIVNTAKGSRKFNQAKASTKGVGNKIKRAGEFASSLGGAAAVGVGTFQILEGAESGNLGQISRGFRSAQLGTAAFRVSQASKASRMGNQKLSREFLKSAGRQVAVGVGQEAALGAYAGYRRTGGAQGLKNRVRSTYQAAQRRRAGVRSTPSGTSWASSAYDRPLRGSKRDSMYAAGFAPEPDAIAI